MNLKTRYSNLLSEAHWCKDKGDMDGYRDFKEGAAEILAEAEANIIEMREIEKEYD